MGYQNRIWLDEVDFIKITEHKSPLRQIQQSTNRIQEDIFSPITITRQFYGLTDLTCLKIRLISI